MAAAPDTAIVAARVPCNERLLNADRTAVRLPVEVEESAISFIETLAPLMSAGDWTTTPLVQIRLAEDGT